MPLHKSPIAHRQAIGKRGRLRGGRRGGNGSSEASGGLHGLQGGAAPQSIVEAKSQSPGGHYEERETEELRREG